MLTVGRAGYAWDVDDRGEQVPEPGSGADAGGLRLHGWRDGPILATSTLVLAAGFGQFGAVAALGDVAREFGEVADGPTLAEQAGLSGTALGVGLAIIRLASLGSLPLAGAADRLGRRRTMIACAVLGLGLTAAVAASPSYWWFVAIFALGRPLLSATNAVAEVTVAEHTHKDDRAWAVALVAAAFGVGAGLIALVRGVAGDAWGFRPVFLTVLVPLALVLLVARGVVEPDRFRALRASGARPLPVLGAVRRPHLGRLALLVVVVVAISAVTGPANSFLFVYAENVLGLPAAATAAMVVGAGASGLLGLLAGRWAADTVGRRLTGAAGLVGVAAFGVLTYSGSTPAVVAGYLLAVLAGSTFAPAVGAMHAELFPTSVRAAVAGWLVAFGVLGAVGGLVAFGAVADLGDRFGTAALVVFAPAALGAVAFAFLPETRGRELEETAA